MHDHDASCISLSWYIPQQWAYHQSIPVSAPNHQGRGGIRLCCWQQGNQCPPQSADIMLCCLLPAPSTTSQAACLAGRVQDVWTNELLCPGTPKHPQNGHHHSPDSPRDSPRGIGSGKPGTLKPNLTVDVTAPPRKDPLASPFQEKVRCL